jgi:hypothetical protein
MEVNRMLMLAYLPEWLEWLDPPDKSRSSNLSGLGNAVRR